MDGSNQETCPGSGTWVQAFHQNLKSGCPKCAIEPAKISKV